MAKKLIGFYKPGCNSIEEIAESMHEAITKIMDEQEKEKAKKEKKPKRCPSCGESQVIPIMYGMPAVPVDESKKKIGGCCISVDSPNWHCKACDCEWQNDHSDIKKIENIQKIIFDHNPVLVVYPNNQFKIDFATKMISWGASHGLGFWQDYDLDPMLENFVLLTTRKWNNFIKKLAEINILDWKSHYHNYNVLDGYEWTMAIVMKGITVYKKGSNGYPETFKDWSQLLEKYAVKNNES